MNTNTVAPISIKIGIFRSLRLNQSSGRLGTPIDKADFNIIAVIQLIKELE
ncbi:hypothetical protein NIES39_L02980 [Arthrospira platensis NIES-39]|nr:hypothetical protein NIES39_L02980 [Arthrospira platensis NIES-39]